jgi:hypothetical protein
MKHAFVTACLNAGISVAKQSDPAAVHKLIERLHPLAANHPLIRTIWRASLRAFPLGLTTGHPSRRT